MKFSKIEFLIIIFLFQVILNREEEIKSFTKFRVRAKTNYYYQFNGKFLEDEKDVYFFFKFYNSWNDPFQLTIIEENLNEIIIDNIYPENETWVSYKLIKLESQKITFKISYITSGELFFIDSATEINGTLDNFTNFNLKTDLIGEKPPLPLQFNIDTIKEDIFYFFKENSKDLIYNGDNLIDYCIIEENEKECNYLGIEGGLKFEKGKKYKIRLNYYKKGEISFFYFDTFYTVKEIEFGLESYESSSFEKDSFFILNTKTIDKFFIYSNQYSSRRIYTSFLSEKEKDLLPNIIDNLEFIEEGYSDDVNEIINENASDYFIFRKSHSNRDDKNIICTFNIYHTIDSYNYNLNLEIEKGKRLGIYKKKSSSYYNNKEYMVLSSNKNMQLIDYSKYTPGNVSKILYLKNDKEEFLYIDSYLENTYIILNEYNNEDNNNAKFLFNLVTNENLNYYFNKYDTDTLFMRTNSLSSENKFNITYLFDIEEKYYLYMKKYNGKMIIYKYNQKLDFLSGYKQFQAIPESYEDQDKYKNINNDLIIIDKFQLFSYYMDYNCLFDIYMQKVEDSENIFINQNIFGFNNLVKLLNENKTYYLNFSVDHLIKLDNKFLNAKIKFVDGEGKEYFLNNSNRVIKDLKGDNITVISSEKALIYFYKRIENYSGEGVVIFDKKQKRKNMLFNITNINNNPISIYIAKDFGFEGYYPMLSKKSWIYVNNKESWHNYISTIYIDNIFDQSDYELYEEEGEEYIIYIFDKYGSFISNNYKIGNITYIDNLMSPKNKYNFEIIPKNTSGSLILNSLNKPEIKYQFILCKNEINNNLRMKVENSNHYNKYFYPYERTIRNEDLELEIDDNEILSHTFELDSKFLFVYDFFYSSSSYNYYSKNELNVNSITQFTKNNILIIFNSAYQSGQNQYYIIVGIKNEFNNIESFSDECYLAQLMTNNSNSIIVKSIIKEYSLMLYEEVNISKLNIKEDTELIISIIFIVFLLKKYYYFILLKNIRLKMMINQ